MVSTHPQPSRLADDAVGDVVGDPIAAAVADAVKHGVLVTHDARECLAVDHPWAVCVAVTELVREIVAEQTREVRAENAALREQLEAERDAANDAINELLQELDDARTGREEPPRRVYESIEAFVAHLDELRGDLERGA